MESIQNLTTIDFPSWIIVGFMILSGFIAMYEIIGKFSDIIGKPVGWIKKRKEDHELLKNTIQTLSSLKEKQENDVEQSIKHDELIKNSVLELSKKVDLLSESILEMRKIQDEDKLAEYKDKIGQSYRYYHERKYSNDNPVPYLNHMEREALEGLIEQYEAHGGKNSFVHSVVEPEMQIWKVID